MTAACGEAGLAGPVFEELAACFRVTIATTPVGPPLLDGTDQAILSCLADGQGWLTSEIAAEIELTPRARARDRHRTARSQAALLPGGGLTGMKLTFQQLEPHLWGAASILRAQSHDTTSAWVFAQEMHWGDAAIGRINSVLHGLGAVIQGGAGTITDAQSHKGGQVRQLSPVLSNLGSPAPSREPTGRRAQLVGEPFGSQETTCIGGSGEQWAKWLP